MRKKDSGSFMLDVKVVKTGAKAGTCVASGAGESVCPVSWGGQFPIREPLKWKGFRGANGAEIEHHGDREVASKLLFRGETVFECFGRFQEESRVAP